MPSREQHGRPRRRRLAQPPREGLQRGHRPLRVDHVRPADVRGIRRDTALVRHQPQQITLAPTPFGVQSQQQPRIPRREQPVTAQAFLPRRGDGPGQPGGQQMRTQRSGAQHPADAAAPNLAETQFRRTAPQLA